MKIMKKYSKLHSMGMPGAWRGITEAWRGVPGLWYGDAGCVEWGRRFVKDLSGSLFWMPCPKDFSGTLSGIPCPIESGKDLTAGCSRKMKQGDGEDGAQNELGIVPAGIDAGAGNDCFHR